MIIPFLAVAAALGLVVVLSTRWRRQSSQKMVDLPKKPWLLLVALALQFLWTHWLSHLGPSAEKLTWILPLSYVPVMCFVAFNWRFTWSRVIAVGVAMNFAVMIANGGTMPAPAQFSSHPPPTGEERIAPGSKDRIVAHSTVLPPFQDQFVVTLPGGSQHLASLGDFVSLSGAVVGLLSTL
jgi:hypothetical protein